MSEARNVLERKMERIGPPSFSYDDVVDRRRRRDRRQRAAAAVIAFALFLPVTISFGLASLWDRVEPADGPQTRAAFVEEASRICAWGRAEFQRVTPLTAPRGDWPFSRTVDHYRKGLPILREVIAQLRGLAPPPGSERQVAAMIDLHERSIDTLARAVAAGDTGDRHTFNHLVRRTFGRTEERLIAAYRRFDAVIDCP
jgi:hypothetical protein